MNITEEAMIYWTTSLYISDAKRLAVYLTKDDIAQIRANAEALACSRHAIVRRCAHRMPASEADRPTASVPAASVPVSASVIVTVRGPAANANAQRPKRARKKGPSAVKLPEGVIRSRPRKKAAGNKGGGDAA
jgi:hypothetical protein